MLWNYLKVSFRNIRRHKLFSVINIASLTLSITICLAVLLLIKNQTDFDTFHPHPDRTFRVITEAVDEHNATERYATAPLPLADRLKEDYPFVEKAVPVYGRSIYVSVTANNKKMDARFAFSTPEFWEVFGLPLQRGNPATALSEPGSVVLTPETAERYFGDTDPMGKDFDIQGPEVFTVTGVLESNLERSHLAFDFLASYRTLEQRETDSGQAGVMGDWSNLGTGHVYVMLRPDARPSQLSGALSSLSGEVSRNHPLQRNATEYRFESQPLSSVSPGEELRYEMGAGKTRSVTELLVFAAVGLVVLVMACFNYTNLSIARSLKRSREVGIYKLFGAYRTQIVGQFVMQSTLIATGSLILAYALLPFIPLPPDIMNEIRTVGIDAELLGWFVLFSIFTGLLAGGMPAWLLSSLQPAESLRSLKNVELIEGLTLRKALVTGQFAISIVLLITATVVYQQSQYAATTDYGFRQENMVNLNLQREVDPQLMKDELAGIPGVELISGISEPFGYFSSPEQFRLQPEGEPIHGDWFSVDRHVVPNLELELAAGRNFTERMAQSPGSHALVNERFLSVAGWETPADAIGKTIYWRDYSVEIAGVVKDFKYKTLSLPMRPMILHHQPEWSAYLNIRLAPGTDRDAFRSRLSKIWHEAAPLLPLEYRNYDEAIYQYQAKEQTVASLGFYALIALSIACLGLLGMVTYTVEVRTQEVGIRKVLGASIGHVISLLSREFVWLLLLAAAIGLPAGYWIGQQFLGTYAYHISIGFGTLFGGFAVMAGLGLLAIGWQTWQVARRNPVEAIRTE